jgi:hypothetical protein
VSGGDAVVGAVDLAEINGQFSFVLPPDRNAGILSVDAWRTGAQATPTQYEISRLL